MNKTQEEVLISTLREIAMDLNRLTTLLQGWDATYTITQGPRAGQVDHSLRETSSVFVKERR